MKLIDNFHHTPGAHCGSTAMSDLLYFFGIDADEPMALGLGGGLCFIYVRDLPDQTPSHAFYGRTLELEHDLSVHLGLDFAEGIDNDSEHAWQIAKSWVDQNIPVLLHVELSGMPYYNTRTRFPGHRVLLVGYDDERQIAFLADTHFPDLQTIAYADLRTARVTNYPPVFLRNEWLAIKSTRAHTPMNQAIVLALRHNAHLVLTDRTPHQNILGMEMLAQDFEHWGDFADWEFCARFGYQNIDRRGTGGGFFRKMHAQFLREAEALGVLDPTQKFSDEMQIIADEWSAFGAILKQIADQKNKALLVLASNAIRQIAKREKSFWDRILDTVEA